MLRRTGCLMEGADEVTRPARRAEKSGDGQDTRVKRVLLIEDHRLIRECLTAMLEDRIDLKTTVQAGSLADARRIWGHLPGEIDMAIVDLDLPNSEGISLVENLCAAGIPVLALTRSEEHTSELQSRQYLVCRLLLEKKKTIPTT